MNVFLGWLGLLVLLLILGPVLTIWSLNTLFPVLNIPYSMETWLAVVILGSGIFGVKSKI